MTTHVYLLVDLGQMSPPSEASPLQDWFDQNQLSSYFQNPTKTKTSQFSKEIGEGSLLIQAELTSRISSFLNQAAEFTRVSDELQIAFGYPLDNSDLPKISEIGATPSGYSKISAASSKKEPEVISNSITLTESETQTKETAFIQKKSVETSTKREMEKDKKLQKEVAKKEDELKLWKNSFAEKEAEIRSLKEKSRHVYTILSDMLNQGLLLK